MRRKVTVIGDPSVVAGSRQYAEIVTWPSPDSGGADVVVVADGDRLEDVADFIARRCPAAVIVATDASWCSELLGRTQFPRGRVIATDDVAAGLDAVRAAAGAGAPARGPRVGVGGPHGAGVGRGGEWSGATVNGASRLCSAAAGGEVLVSEHTHAAAGKVRGVAFGERRVHWLRNVAEPV